MALNELEIARSAVRMIMSQLWAAKWWSRMDLKREDTLVILCICQHPEDFAKSDHDAKTASEKLVK